MKDDEIIGEVITWLETITGVTVIEAYQSGPRPAIPYVMVNMTGTVDVRDHAQDIEYTGDQAAPVLEIEWQFSIHAFGVTGSVCTDLLRPIRSAIELTQVMEPLWPKLVVHDISQVRSVPEWINEAWEPRAQLDMMLRGLTRDGFVIDPIEETQPFKIERIV